MCVCVCVFVCVCVCACVCVYARTLRRLMPVARGHGGASLGVYAYLSDGADKCLHAGARQTLILSFPRVHARPRPGKVSRGGHLQSRRGDQDVQALARRQLLTLRARLCPRT